MVALSICVSKHPWELQALFGFCYRAQLLQSVATAFEVVHFLLFNLSACFVVCLSTRKSCNVIWRGNVCHCVLLKVYDAGPMFCFAFIGSCFIVIGMVSLRLSYVLVVTEITPACYVHWLFWWTPKPTAITNWCYANISFARIIHRYRLLSKQNDSLASWQLWNKPLS